MYAVTIESVTAYVFRHYAAACIYAMRVHGHVVHVGDLEG